MTAAKTDIMDESKDLQLEAKLAVVNTLGLHARAAAKIAETAACFECRITLHKDGIEADADSVLAILGLDAPKGTSLTVRAAGAGADSAMDAISRLFSEGFGEDTDG